MNLTAKERAIACKTLICFLQSLIDEVCDLELKNDLQVNGKLLNVDSNMNVELKDVKLRRPTSLSLDEFTIEYYDYMFLKGEKIRYVQFNDEIDVKQNIDAKLDEYHGRTRNAIKNTQYVHQFRQDKYERQKNLLLSKKGN